MNHPQSKWQQYEGKAIATCSSGMGCWPSQPHPCELIPPCPEYSHDTVTPWDCYVNDWHGPFAVSRLGKPICGPVVLPPGRQLTLPPASWASHYSRLVPISVEQFSDDEATIGQADQLLRSLPHVNRPVSFEISGYGPGTVPEMSEPYITIKFVADCDDAPTLYRQLQATYPNSAIVLGDRLTNTDMLISHLLHEYGGYINTLQLASMHIYPLLAIKNLKPDPLAVAIASMEDIPDSGWALVQVLFCPMSSSSERVSRESLEDPYKLGQLLFSDVTEEILDEKFSAPLFAVAIRIAADDPSIHQQLYGWANQFSKPPQELCLSKQDTEQTMGHAVGARCVYWPGMALNSSELAAIVHLPGPNVSSERLRRIATRTRAAPETSRDPDSVLLGYNVHRGQEREVSIPGQVRGQHCYLFGKTGTGKTTLMERMIWQDIHAGHGVGVIDPHGDLFDRILTYIPEHRIKDVVIFDPTDREHPPAFNILRATDQLERERVTNETIRIMKELSGQSWGPRLDHYLRNGLLSLMWFRDATMQTLYRVYTDDKVRQAVIKKLPDPTLRDFWIKEYANRQKTATDPLMTRLGKFMTSETIRNVVCQQQSKYDFDDIINNKRILVVKLPAGLLPEDAAILFGACLIAKLISAAFRRQERPESERVPFRCYLDEFQRFMNLSAEFDTILSEMRKYRLELTLAHQFTGQLSLKVRQAIFGNVGTKVMFQIGAQDAPTIKSELGEFTSQELLSLEVGHAIVTMTGAREAFNIRTYDRPPAEPGNLTTTILRWSRKQHCGRPVRTARHARQTVQQQPVVNKGTESVTATTKPKRAGPRRPSSDQEEQTPTREKADGKRTVSGAEVKPLKDESTAATPTADPSPTPLSPVEHTNLVGGHDDPYDDFV